MSQISISPLDSKKRKTVEVEHISTVWKKAHITLLSLSSISAMSAGFSLAVLSEPIPILCRTPKISIFKPISKSKPEFTADEIPIGLDLIGGIAEDQTCNFLNFAFILSFISGVIWIAFFIVTGPGGKAHEGMPQPWRIVLPAFIFTTLMFLFNLTVTIKLHIVMKTFCTQFVKEIRLHTKKVHSCAGLSIFNVLSTKFSLSILMYMSIIFAWLCCITWGISAVVLLLRIFKGADFRKVFVTSMELEEYILPDDYQQIQRGERIIPSTQQTSLITIKATIERDTESSSEAEDAIQQEVEELSKRRKRVRTIPSVIMETPSTLRRRASSSRIDLIVEAPKTAEIGCQAGEPMVKRRKHKKAKLEPKQDDIDQ